MSSLEVFLGMSSLEVLRSSPDLGSPLRRIPERGASLAPRPLLRLPVGAGGNSAPKSTASSASGRIKSSSPAGGLLPAPGFGPDLEPDLGPPSWLPLLRDGL